MNNNRELEKKASKMGVKRAPRKAVVQYARGFEEGMHIAYRAVAKKMLNAGQSEEAVRQFLTGLVTAGDLKNVMEEAVR